MDGTDEKGYEDLKMLTDIPKKARWHASHENAKLVFSRERHGKRKKCKVIYEEMHKRQKPFLSYGPSYENPTLTRVILLARDLIILPTDLIDFVVFSKSFP